MKNLKDFKKFNESLSNGESIFTEYQNFLFRGKTEIDKQFLKMTDEDGESLLYLLVKFIGLDRGNLKSSEIADLCIKLIEMGADLNVLDRFGSPLIATIDCDYVSPGGEESIIRVAKKLLENGADVNSIDRYRNMSILMISARYNLYDYTKFLLDNGAKFTKSDLKSLRASDKIFKLFDPNYKEPDNIDEDEYEVTNYRGELSFITSKPIDFYGILHSEYIDYEESFEEMDDFDMEVIIVDNISIAKKIFKESKKGIRKIGTDGGTLPNAIGIYKVDDKYVIIHMGTYPVEEFRKFKKDGKVYELSHITKYQYENGIIGDESLTSILKKLSENIEKTDLSNRVFVFSGVRDKNLEDLIVKRGGTVTNSINKKVTDLVMKKLNTGSTKEIKAKELNINIITLDDLNDLIR